MRGINDRDSHEAVIRVRRLRGAVEHDRQVAQYVATDAKDTRYVRRHVGKLTVEHEPPTRKINELDGDIQALVDSLENFAADELVRNVLEACQPQYRLGRRRCSAQRQQQQPGRAGQ